MPDYRLDEAQPITERTGGVFGLDHLPLAWKARTTAEQEATR
jgi:hypothetical protein